MTVKEAVIRSLEELNSPSTYRVIYNHIVDNKYYFFLDSKTPEATVSSILGDFVRAKDNRVKRIKLKNNSFLYSINKEIKDKGKLDSKSS